MFGIDQISWGQFTRFVLAVLLAWYLGLLLVYFFQKKRKHQAGLFEDDGVESLQSTTLEPISVSSQDLPPAMLPFVPITAVFLSVSYYEEMGMDDGYSLDRLQNSKDPLPPEVMEQIQFQQ
jgi:hypothetical protein